MKKISISTLGCKVNQFESASFSDSLSHAGYEIVGHHTEADYIIINSCAVTAAAGSQSRHSLRQALRTSPDATILITGCYVESGHKELEAIDELHGRKYHIVGNSQKDQIVPIIIGEQEQQNLLGSINHAEEICRLPVRRFGERSRTYLRIQDGCESFCTYCIVPYTRGPSRSLPMDEVLTQARIFQEEGYHETVLTGIHIGNWGKDLAGTENFTDLMANLVRELPEMKFRISSLEPTEITDRLLTLMQENDNILPHLHIPLQSGDDEILKRMNRHYTTSQFAEIIHKCHNAIPDICIGIDILAGFPGESREQFNGMLNFLEELPFTYLHVFPYSIRPGTKAAEFTDQISGDIKSERVKALRALSDRKKHAFYQKQLGKEMTIQVEGKRTSDGCLRGYSNNYTLVHFKGDDTLIHQTARVHLQENHGEYVYGKLID